MRSHETDAIAKLERSPWRKDKGKRSNTKVLTLKKATRYKYGHLQLAAL